MIVTNMTTIILVVLDCKILCKMFTQKCALVGEVPPLMVRTLQTIYCKHVRLPDKQAEL